MAKGKKKLSKKDRLAAKIARIKERAAKDLERQIARAQGVKDAHGSKTAKLREKMKAQRAGFKAKQDELRKKLEVKFEAKLAKAAKRAESKTERAVKKAVRTATREADKKLRKLARFTKLIQKMGEEKPAPVVTAKNHPENQPQA